MVSGRCAEDNESADTHCFQTPEDESTYWKRIAGDYADKLQHTRNELEEFQEGSRELEAELETELEKYEKQMTDLTNDKCKLEEENKLLKETLTSTEKRATELHDANVEIKSVRDELMKYIRKLEQSNDDLERSKRATNCSLEQFDVRLNDALERNAFLETELEEKEQVILTVRKEKDEMKNENRKLNNKFDDSERGCNSSHPDHKCTVCLKGTNDTIKAITNESDSLKGNSSVYNSALSIPVNNKQVIPSPRISAALSTVSDLLLKVCSLEEKLSSCRNFIRENPINKTLLVLRTRSNVHVDQSSMKLVGTPMAKN